MSERRCKTCGVAKTEEQFNIDHGKRGNVCHVCRHEKTAPAPAVDADMLQFGVGAERAAAEAWLAHGSISAASDATGISPRMVRVHLAALCRTAAKRGHAPGSDMTRVAPEGFSVKGVSTLYGEDGTVKAQWVKTRQDEQDKYEALLRAVASLGDEVRGLADPVLEPVGLLSADLLNVIPIGDPHIGMYAWAAESGADFDLAIAEREMFAAVDRLVSLAPDADECLLLELGDLVHADNFNNVTFRSGHHLDVDTRWSKVMRVAIRTLRRCVDRALERHRLVRLRCEIGNHDDHTSVMLATALEMYYEREPRVVIDTNPSNTFYHRHGKCLIASTHGDAIKPAGLPGVMAVDRARDWGETEFRHWYVGHVHHESVKEYPGVTVETFRTLAARDAWTARSGYRSGRDMRLDVWHREYGLINRHIVGINWIQQNGRAA